MNFRVGPAVHIAVVFAILTGQAIGSAQMVAPDVSIQRLAYGDWAGAVRKPAGRTTSGRFLESPPAPRLGGRQDRVLRPTPAFEDSIFIPPTQAVETGETTRQAPGSGVVVRNTTLSPPTGYVSSVAEPNVGTQGDGIFMTHNWYAEISTNNGTSFSYINPDTQFPSSPSAFAAGFCCDQRVAQDQSRDLIFWLLQYIETGNTSTSTNGYRIAVAHGQAALASNTWQYHDFTPADFGLPLGKSLDFPHMQVSANYLYFTANVFDTVTDGFYGAVIGRIPLDALNANTSFTMNTYVTTTFGSIAPVNGATATMYFGAVATSTSIKVLTWPESQTTPVPTDVIGLSSTTSGVTYNCPSPDGLNPCGRADRRMQTGWITASELGFMWTSAQNGGTRPYPYTRVAILDPSTLAVISQPDIFSTSHAFLYPAIAVNARGHLGGTIDRLGGIVYTSLRAIIRDDFSPDVTASGWELIPIAEGDSGTVSRWGDFNGIVPHEKFPNTWVGVGHVQIGTSSNSGSSLRNFWFMRERDLANVPAVTADSVTPSSGMGASQVFALQYGDTAGFADLATTWVWFNATFATSAANSCMAYYDRAANRLSLLNDAGTQWMSSSVGTTGTLANKQCAIALAGSSVQGTGNTLILNLAMTFTGAFAGAKNIYMYAGNATGQNSGWQLRGTWTVAGGVTVTADSATPNSGTGTSQVFALQYGDTAGFADLATTWVWFNATFATSAANSCMAYYDRAANRLSLLNDAGTQWMSSSVGTTGTLANAQCAIALTGSSVQGTGNTLILNLAMTFTGAYAGAKNIYMYAGNATGQNSGWQLRGVWNVPAF